MGDATDAFGRIQRGFVRRLSAKSSKGLLRKSPKHLSFTVAGARNHLQANTSLAFRFEVTI